MFLGSWVSFRALECETTPIFRFRRPFQLSVSFFSIHPYCVTVSDSTSSNFLLHARYMRYENIKFVPSYPALPYLVISPFPHFRFPFLISSFLLLERPVLDAIIVIVQFARDQAVVSARDQALALVSPRRRTVWFAENT